MKVLFGALEVEISFGALKCGKTFNFFKNYLRLLGIFLNQKIVQDYRAVLHQDYCGQSKDFCRDISEPCVVVHCILQPLTVYLKAKLTNRNSIFYLKDNTRCFLCDELLKHCPNGHFRQLSIYNCEQIGNSSRQSREEKKVFVCLIVQTSLERWHSTICQS